MSRMGHLFRVVTIIGLLGMAGACDNESGVGSDTDASGNSNNPGADAAHIDGALPDAAQVFDAAVDAFVRPPGDAFVLPENPYDAFVHPPSPFGPAMVINSLEIQPAAHGIGPFAGVVNPDVQTALDNGQLLLVVEFLDLDSTTGVIDDPDVTLVLYRAEDADGVLGNNFTGAGQFNVEMETATVIAGASITNGALLVPAGTFPYLSVNIPGMGELVIIDPELSMQVTNDFGGATDGEIFGAVPSRTLDLLPNQSGIGNPNASILDLMAASIFELQPDVDIDGDGQLETYEDRSPSNPTYDEMISICYDYFGVFENDNCPQFPEIWDGYSIGLDYTAVPCTIVGTVP